jgi:hypothetical protein
LDDSIDRCAAISRRNGRCHDFMTSGAQPRTNSILFAESLNERFAVRIEQFLATLLPRRSEFRSRDVPVWPALLKNRAQVLAKILYRRSAEKPVAVIDLVNDKTGLKNNHMRDHRIVDWVCVFGNIEIFLNHATRVGEERPVRAHATPIFVGLTDIVGTNRDQPAIRNLQFSIQLNQTFPLPSVLRAKTSAAQHENHRIWPLEFRKLPPFRGVV